MNKYWNSIVYGVVLTGLTYLIAWYAGWVDIHAVAWLELAAVATSYVCTLLCVYQSRWNYPIGIVSTVLYSWLLFKAELPAVALFNLYLVASQTYGWFRWKNDEDTRPVTDIAGLWWLSYAAFGVGVYGLLYLVNWYFGYAMGTLDAVVAVLSGVAQWGLDNKKLQNWHIWAIVNVLSLYLYFHQGLYLVTLQYVYFLGNTIYGWYSWKNTTSAPADLDAGILDNAYHYVSIKTQE